MKKATELGAIASREKVFFPNSMDRIENNSEDAIV
jgi:hypothetical protein